MAETITMSLGDMYKADTFDKKDVLIPGKPKIEEFKDNKGKTTSIVQYDFLAVLPKNTGTWIENCINCHVPMRQVQISNDVKLLGIPDSARYQPKAFDTWKLNPLVSNTNLWGCYGCDSIWTIAMGEAWVKVSLNGLSDIRMNNVKPLIPEQEEVPKVAYDLGIETEGSTKCPECHAWRDVKDYSETEVIHVCPNCKTGQVIPMSNPDTGE